MRMGIYREDTPTARYHGTRMSLRRTALLMMLVVALPLGLPQAAGAQSSQPRVDIVKVEGPLDRPLIGFVNDALDDAEAHGATVVLELDTAGTLGQDGVALADRVASMKVPVLVWVGPVPAKASGAGLLLMYASSLAAVAPGSQTGPLYPVDVLHPDRTEPGLDATIDGWLAARGRTVQRAHEDEAMPAAEAIRYGFAVDTPASSVLDLLNRVDGTTVPTANGPVVLHTKIAETDADVVAGRGVSIRFLELGPIKRVAHGVASPSMVYVLLVVGLACLAFEQTQLGFGFAGFAGIFLLALAAYGMTLAVPSWLGLGVLLAGVGAMVLDVRLRRFGVFTWAGLTAFLAGSILLYRGVAPAIRISPWLIGATTIASFLFYGFGLTVAMQSRDRIVSTQRGLIGLTGEARGRLAPDGPVFVKGALWRGRSLGLPIDPGTRVRVRGVDGMVLRVEAEAEPARGS